jgi:hypothetical protein
MQPYQRAAQAIREGEEKPLHLLKNIGLSAAGGGAASLGAKSMSRIVPAVGALISKYVPDNILTAGLSKLDPRLGTFMQGAIDAGYSHDDIRDFMGEKIEKSQEQKPATDKKNIIEMHSPELHKFITEHMKKGRTHIEAGALAQMEGKETKHFKSIIKKLEQEHKTPWSSILEAVYGGAQAGTQNAAPAAQTAQAPAQQASQGQGQQQSDAQSQFKQELAALLKS